MFDFLRKMIIPIIVTVLVFFLAMIVLEWGLDISQRQQNISENVAGMINGEEVSWQAFQRVYNNFYQSEAQDSNYEVSEERTRELEQQAWQEIVTDRILTQEADKYNVQTTDEDLFIYLQVNPPMFLRELSVFQTNGQFDYQKYINAMADEQYAGLWASIEPQVRADIRKLKLQQMIVQAAHVSEEEVRQAFLDTQEKVSVAVVNAPRTKYTAQVGQPTDAEAQAYYDAHREDYEVGERVVLDIIKLSKEPSEFDQQAAQARAQEVYDSVKAGSDFAEMARIFSDDLSNAPSGGDLGWFASGRMVREFDSAVFSMKAGDISHPVKTSFGWHIIKHNGYRDTVQTGPDGKEQKVREANAQHILIKPNASDDTLERLWQQLDMVRTLAENMDFNAAATQESLTVYRTEPLVKGVPVQYLGGSPEVVEWAFKNEPGTISNPLDLGQNYALVRLVEKLPAGYADFKDVRDRAIQAVIRERALQLCRDTITAVFADVNAGRSLRDAAARHNLSYDTVPPFGRLDRVNVVMSDPAAIGAAFAIKDVGGYSGPVDYQGGCVIFELRSRQSADLTQYEVQRDSVYNAVLSTKQRDTYNSWYGQLRQNATIVSNIDFQRRR